MLEAPTELVAEMGNPIQREKRLRYSLSQLSLNFMKIIETNKTVHFESINKDNTRRVGDTDIYWV